MPFVRIDVMAPESSIEMEGQPGLPPSPLDPALAESDIGALKRQSVHGSAMTFAAQGTRFLIKLATQVLIARLLLPADYGLVAMVAPILSLSYLMGELGLGQAIILQPSITAAEISSLFWFSLALNSVLAGTLMLLSPGIAWLYHEPRTIEITLALAALLPITGLAAQHIALLNRQMRFVPLAVLDVVPPAVGLAAGLAAALSEWGYWSLIAVAAAEAASTVIVGWSLSRWRPGRPIRHGQIGKLIRMGGDITGYNLAGYVATSCDNILLGVFQGSAALGLYDRGRRLVTQPIGQLLIPVGRVAMPLLTRLRPDAYRYKCAYLDMLRILMLAAMPGILFAMMMARPLIVFLLGGRWEGVAPVFAWLCLGSLASPLYSSTFWLFTTQDRTRRQMIYVTATSVISVIAFVAGLPWGPVGVAAGAGLSFVLLSTPLVCWGATKDGLVTPIDLAMALLPLLIAGSATAAGLEIVRTRMLLDGAALLATSAILSYGFFVGVLLCLPFGQPIVRRAWHFGTLLTQGWGTAA
jgi:PST family polysaccharide transporter